MNAFVTAVVVSHDADEFFAITAKKLAAQTRLPDRTLVVDTSVNPENAPIKEISEALGFEYLKLPASTSLQSAIDAATQNIEAHNQWLWLLHDDSAPDADALAAMLAAETDPHRCRMILAGEIDQALTRGLQKPLRLLSRQAADVGGLDVGHARILSPGSYFLDRKSVV